MKKINNISELKNILASAKAGGQFVTLYGESEVKLNKFPTDGSARIRIDDAFKPIASFSVQFHFGADYEKAMSKALGVDYVNGGDANRETLIPNVMMRYISTNNVCLIYMATSRSEGETTLNGHALTAAEWAYLKRYKSKNKGGGNIVNYRTISAKNVKRIAIKGEVYEVNIS